MFLHPFDRAIGSSVKYRPFLLPALSTLAPKKPFLKMFPNGKFTALVLHDGLFFFFFCQQYMTCKFLFYLFLRVLGGGQSRTLGFGFSLSIMSVPRTELQSWSLAAGAPTCWATLPVLVWGFNYRKQYPILQKMANLCNQSSWAGVKIG